MKNPEKAQICRLCPHWKVLNHRPCCGKLERDIHTISACPDGVWSNEPGMLEKTASFADAQLGVALGEIVSDEEFERRQSICLGNGSAPECPHVKRRKDNRPYCGLCGCGSRDGVLLDGDKSTSKLGVFARLKCRANKW